MNYDWETLLKDKSPDRKFDIFLEKINIAKEKCIPQINSRAGKKAKKHNYMPLDEKTINNKEETSLLTKIYGNQSWSKVPRICKSQESSQRTG